MLIPACSSPTKVYRIARDNSWYGMGLMGKERSLMAFVDELLQNIAQDEKVKLEIIEASNRDLFVGLGQGLYDAVISNMLPTPIKREEYDFSEPLFLLGPVLVVPKNSSISNLVEMEHKSIGIQRSASLVFNMERFPNLTVIPYDNLITALENLGAGQLDGVIMDVVPAYIFISSLYKDHLKIATAPLTLDGLRIISLANNKGENVMGWVDHGLKEAKDNGTYDRLLKKWGLFNPWEAPTEVPGSN